MFEQPRIAPSILSADFLHLQDQIELIEEAGAGFIHVDVMDGHFVPNLTIGVPIVKQLAKIARIPLDVHLMIENPLRELPWFIDAGANMVTMHIEAFENEDEVYKALEMAHDAGVGAALSVRPKTPVSALVPYIEQLDMALIMSVEPGFSGQSYIAGSEDKVAQLAKEAKRANVSPLIQIDGGIGLSTVALSARAGADVFVCGNAVYGAQDPAFALREIENAAKFAQREVLGK